MPTDTRACSCDQCCRTIDFHDVKSSLKAAIQQVLACPAALATHPCVDRYRLLPEVWQPGQQLISHDDTTCDQPLALSLQSILPLRIRQCHAVLLCKPWSKLTCTLCSIVSTVRQFLKLGAAVREPGARTQRGTSAISQP